jgi:hypothetical protein
MTDSEDMKAVEDRVIAAITSGEVRMRSRWYFVLQSILLAGVIAVLLLLTLFVVSFMVYSLQQSGAWFGVHLGVSGWYVFFASVPWSLLFVSLALIVILATLLDRYSFVYHRPLLYALLGILVVVGLGGSLLAGTSFHTKVLRYAATNGTPVVANFYRFYGNQASSEIHRGIVAAISRDGFIMRDAEGQSSDVVVGPEGGSGGSLFHVGDAVVVFGVRAANGSIKPFGVENLGQI